MESPQTSKRGVADGAGVSCFARSRSHSSEMLYEYGLLSEWREGEGGGGRRCGESLLGNGSAAVLVWMDSGGAAKQSGVECICAGCGHACNLSQSVSQSAP